MKFNFNFRCSCNRWIEIAAEGDSHSDVIVLTEKCPSCRRKLPETVYSQAETEYLTNKICQAEYNTDR